MVSQEEFNKLTERLNAAKTAVKFAQEYFEILTGRIKYTNDDINRLLNYYIMREMYEICERLIKLK